MVYTNATVSGNNNSCFKSLGGKIMKAEKLPIDSFRDDAKFTRLVNGGVQHRQKSNYKPAWWNF